MKKQEEISELFKEYKRLKREERFSRIIIALLGVMAVLLSAHVFMLVSPPAYSYDNQVSVNMKDVCMDYQPTIKKMLDDLKPEYANVVKNITFTTNETLINSLANDPVWGFNLNGNIWILVDGNEERERITLCHEILHNIVRKNGLMNDEIFVYDIADYGVCYE